MSAATRSCRSVLASVSVLLVVGVSAVSAQGVAAARDTTDPTVVVVTPTAGAAVATSVSLTGTARDDKGVDTVLLRLRRGDGKWFDGTTWTSSKTAFRARLSDRGGSRTNWSRRVPVDAGQRYVVSAFSVDRGKNRSDVVSRSFRAVPAADLGVSLDGRSVGRSFSEWRITVTNSGGPTVGETVVSFQPDSFNLLGVSGLPAGWTCRQVAGLDSALECRAAPPFARGATAVITVLVASSNELGLSAQVTVSTPGDTNESNNTADDSFTTFVPDPWYPNPFEPDPYEPDPYEPDPYVPDP